MLCKLKSVQEFTEDGVLLETGEVHKKRLRDAVEDRLTNALHDLGNHAKVCMIIMHCKLTLCMIGSYTDCVYIKNSNAVYFTMYLYGGAKNPPL